MSRIGTVVAILLAALVGLPAVAEEVGSPTDRAPAVASMAVARGSISWTPQVAFDKLVLTVEGGGFTATQEFSGGRPYFTPVDPEGYLLPDGTYTWEMTVISRARALDSARARGDEESANGRSMKSGSRAPALVQSGAFTIVNGAIVDPQRDAESAARQQGADGDVDDADGASR